MICQSILDVGLRIVDRLDLAITLTRLAILDWIEQP
jgi:hypothetical protein